MGDKANAFPSKVHGSSLLSQLSRSAMGIPEACIFCTESTGQTMRDYARHVGRHMEEIAFSVLPTQYEDWDSILMIRIKSYLISNEQLLATHGIKKLDAAAMAREGIRKSP